MSGSVQFQALSTVVRGYALAVVFGVVLAQMGFGLGVVALAIWLGGALATLVIASAAASDSKEAVRLPVRAVRFQDRVHQR